MLAGEPTYADSLSSDSVASLRRIGELRGGSGSSGRRRRRGHRRGLPRVRVAWLAWLLVAAGVGGIIWAGGRYMGSGVTVQGIEDGEIVTPTELAARDLTVAVSGDPSSAKIRLNGHDVGGVVRDGTTLRFRLPTLVDGTYELSVTSDRRPIGKVTTKESFVVDGTPPAMDFATLAPRWPSTSPW